MHESYIALNNMYHKDSLWFLEQNDVNTDEYAKIYNAYHNIGEKKLSLRRELSGLKDRTGKETEHASTQTETTQTKKAKTTTQMTQTDKDLKTKQVTDAPSDRTDEHIRLLKLNIESTDKLTKSIEKLSQETNENMSRQIDDLDRERVEQKAAGTCLKYKRPAAQPVLYSVAVAPADPLKQQWTADDVLIKVRDVLEARTGKVEVEKVRKAKNAKVIVSCRTEAARTVVKDKLEIAKQDIIVQNIQNKDPLIIMRDVSKHNSDDDILAALKNQNEDVFANLKDEEMRLTIAYKRQARNPHAHHIVLRVSPQLWQRSTERGALKIDLQRVRVLDQSPLVQCSICLGYGHSRKYCTQNVESCSHCGGTHKIGKQCADWLAGAPPSCTNCVKATMDKTDHNAFDAVCPIRRKWDTLARSTVAYS